MEQNAKIVLRETSPLKQSLHRSSGEWTSLEVQVCKNALEPPFNRLSG